MDKRSQSSQYLAANPGWLALFEDVVDGAMVVRSEPVIAWRLGAGGGDLAKAIVGASPWLEKADKEDAQHYFALVREEQLEPEFLAELRASSVHVRGDILGEAERNRRSRVTGHESWVRDRRSQRRLSRDAAPLRIF